MTGLAAAAGGAELEEVLQPASIVRPAERRTADNTGRRNWAIGMVSSQYSWSHCVALAAGARALPTVARAPGGIMRRSRRPSKWLQHGRASRFRRRRCRFLDVDGANDFRIGKVRASLMAGCVNAGHCTDIVHLARIAGNPYRPDNLAGSVSDELAARLQEHRPIGQFHQVFHKYWLLAVLLQHQERRPPHRQRCISLAVGDLET